MTAPELDRAFEVLRAEGAPTPRAGLATRVAIRALAEREEPTVGRFIELIAFRGAVVSALAAAGMIVGLVVADREVNAAPQSEASSTDIASALQTDQPWIGAETVYRELLGVATSEG